MRNSKESMPTADEKEFAEKWIPAIRKLRKKGDDGLLPSMNTCLLIIKENMDSVLEKQNEELTSFLVGMVGEHELFSDEFITDVIKKLIEIKQKPIEEILEEV